MPNLLKKAREKRDFNDRDEEIAENIGYLFNTPVNIEKKAVVTFEFLGINSSFAKSVSFILIEWIQAPYQKTEQPQDYLKRLALSA